MNLHKKNGARLQKHAKSLVLHVEPTQVIVYSEEIMRFRWDPRKASVLDRGGQAWTSHDKFNHAQILIKSKKAVYLHDTVFFTIR